MNNKVQDSYQIIKLIHKFKTSLKRFFSGTKKSKFFNYSTTSHEGFYESAKKAQTEQRNLGKALEFYIKAIQHGQKKDSTIKDFASSLHQLGYTRQAVKFMDQCQIYYDGNKDKYFRLRDNLELQIRPTGKHQCRFILLQELPQEFKSLNSKQQIKSLLFKVPKRIKNIKFYSNFNLNIQCDSNSCCNVLFEFQSYSAAKKTLEGFNFDQYFGVNLYWVNSKSMRITCLVVDGKNDFQEGLVIDQEILQIQKYQLNNEFWVSFGEQIYGNKNSNGFMNLLATHLLKEQTKYQKKQMKDKQNIYQNSIIQNKNKNWIEETETNWSHVEQYAFYNYEGLNLNKYKFQPNLNQGTLWLEKKNRNRY